MSSDADSLTALAVIARELRSPLLGIRGIARVLAETTVTMERRAALAAAVAEEATLLLQRLDDLVSTGALASGQASVAPRPVDVSDVVRRVYERMVAAGVDEGRLDVSIALWLGRVYVDPDALDRILWNLLDNAIRHGTGVTHLQVRRDAGMVVLRVVDEGPGFPDSLNGAAVEPFVSGPGGGAGIGLTLVQGLVDAHGGQLELGKAEGGGAAVTVRLPG